jgi:hypothetical protein
MKPWTKAAVQGAACGLMLGVVLLSGGRLWQPQVAAAQAKQPAVPDVVKAKRFEVVDVAGRVRVFLEATSGAPGLTLLDAAGRQRLDLLLREHGSPTLQLLDKNGKLRAVVGAAHFETEKTKDVTMTSESTLALCDKDGNVIWKVP